MVFRIVILIGNIFTLLVRSNYLSVDSPNRYKYCGHLGLFFSTLNRKVLFVTEGVP